MSNQHSESAMDAETFFEPKSINDYFVGITKLPHPSGAEDPVRKYVHDEVVKIDPSFVVHYVDNPESPKDRVIVLRCPGSSEYAQRNPVILQAHMDMVCNPGDMRFPLRIVADDSQTEGTWLKARDANGRDSTLGADDGIGVATALALLADEDMRRYPIECLFTVQEETDMAGAQTCDLGLLKGDTLLNLDAEDLKTIIYGSAGGSRTAFSVPTIRSGNTDGLTFVSVSISGLRGGHSGVDIGKGRQNAIKLLAQALASLDGRIAAVETAPNFDLLIWSMERTDVVKSNAIPTAAAAIVAMPSGQAEPFIERFNSICASLKMQLKDAEPGFQHAADTIKGIDSAPLDRKSTDTLLCTLSMIPSGVVAMKPEVPGVVETSSNLFDVAFQSGVVTIGISNRSSRDSSLFALNATHNTIAAIMGVSVETGMDRYASWQPDESSPILKIASEVYKGMYHGTESRTVIHAGLECGTLACRFLAEQGRSLDCISIGPTIRNPHTPNETLQVASGDKKQTVQQFHDCVRDIIKKHFA